MFGVFYTFLSLIWFITAENLKNKEKINSFIIKIAKLLDFCVKIVCCKKKKTIKLSPAKDERKEIEVVIKLCNKCEKCENCLLNKRKENQKADENKEKKKIIETLNLAVCFFILFSQFFSYLYIWLSISK